MAFDQLDRSRYPTKARPPSRRWRFTSAFLVIQDLTAIVDAYRSHEDIGR
jgi:hypothetical protein